MANPAEVKPVVAAAATFASARTALTTIPRWPSNAANAEPNWFMKNMSPISANGLKWPPVSSKANRPNPTVPPKPGRNSTSFSGTKLEPIKKSD